MENETIVVTQEFGGAAHDLSMIGLFYRPILLFR